MTEQPTLDETTAAFLKDECDRLFALYNQAQANAQSVFNFYLTFVSAVLGALVVIFQANEALPVGLVSVVLLFTVLVGSVYLSALSGRYAQSARYAFALDAIRRYLIDTQGLRVPPLYDAFLQKPLVRARTGWLYYLVPTGTYQMFMAFINSFALALMMGLIFSVDASVSGRGLFAAVVIFLLTLSILNAYSRWIIVTLGSSAIVDIWMDTPAWAGKE
ncbi:MAG: hypothetical protein OHK0046_40980 [Anaerolineae bacterium]